MIESILEQSKTQVDKASATVLVSDDPRMKRFIGEALLVGAILYLLQQYCSGFFKGLGLDDLGESHGKKARQFIKRIRKSKVTNEYLDPVKKDVEAAIQKARQQDATDLAVSKAESSVQETLVEAGVVRAQAVDIARGLSGIILGE